MNEFTISTESQETCDKTLLDAAKKSALYTLARKDKLVKITIPNYDPDEPAGVDDVVEEYETLKALVQFNESELLPAGYGDVSGEPSELVRLYTDTNAVKLAEMMDALIIDQVALRAPDKSSFIRYKKCLTMLNLKEAALQYSGDRFRDKDGDYLICATSLGRLDTLAEVHGWEDEMFYMDFIDRPLHTGEYGRIRVTKDLTVVFLTSGDDEQRDALLFGPDALVVTPVDDSLHATFAMRQSQDPDEPPCLAVGYTMDFGARADMTKCVVLTASKAITPKPEARK